MITREESNKIVNSTASRAGVLVAGRGHTNHIVKMHYIFKNLLLYSHCFGIKEKYRMSFCLSVQQNESHKY